MNLDKATGKRILELVEENMGAKITLKEFYDREYFNDFDDVC